MSFRVITSCYTDSNLLETWIPELERKQILYTVYQKDTTLQKGEEKKEGNMIYIPNYGRCDYAFLYHIVKNYDQLEDITLFVKNNWKSQHIDVWNHVHVCKNVDFMESGKQRRFQYWSDRWTPFPRHEELHKTTHDYAQTAYDWYQAIFPDIDPPVVVPGWGMGPCFSVSKRLIHRHPKKVYEYLLERFYPESKSWDIEKAKVRYPTLEEQLEDIGKHYHDCFQRFWYILFTHHLPFGNNYKISDHSWNNVD
jgi:hypothetical protein